MNTIPFYIAAHVYSGTTQLANVAATICSINGQTTPCTGDSSAMVLSLFFAIFFAIILLTVIGMWKVFEKAGKPGWASIVPVYNVVVLLQIVRKPIWWIVLCFIPYVNSIVLIMVYYYLAKVFGKGSGFTIGIVFIPYIFIPILGFDKSTYIAADSANTTV